jgi:prepilin-type N-terminal cleavage/methylation domain-containing protein
MLKKYSQKGFTIVELLIVIVVIGILAALVLNTFSGAQKRARDTERQGDINALATQLEVYYNDKGAYPQWSQINDETKAKTAFPGLDVGAMNAPSNTTTFDLKSNASTGVGEYGYQAYSDTAKTTACGTNDACVKFTLSYQKEELKTGETNPLTKDSLN